MLRNMLCRDRFLSVLTGVFAAFVMAVSSGGGSAHAASGLQIFVVDVEGGGATLIVAPSGQSMLVDTGNPPPGDERDASRIEKAMRLAGIKKNDYLLTTHYDGDHVGGVAAVDRIAHFSKFFDHGDLDPSLVQNSHFEERWKTYVATAGSRRTTVQPGDKLPFKNLKVEVVSSHGKVLSKPINGGAANRYCEGAERKDPDKTENSQTAGILITYGKFTFLNLGDLTWDKEMQLACPENKLGRVTVFLSTHHGFYSDMSGAPAHVWGIQPQVVIVNNGPRKSLPPQAWERISKIKDVQGVWQSHLALLNDKDHNTTEDMIANLEPSAECKGNWIKVQAEPKGNFTVTNGRNNVSKTYQAR